MRQRIAIGVMSLAGEVLVVLGAAAYDVRAGVTALGIVLVLEAREVSR